MRRRLIKPKKIKESIEIDNKTGEPISADVEENIDIIKSLFESCADVKFRSFKVQEYSAYLIYIDGLIDNMSIQFSALHELLSKTRIEHLNADFIQEKMVSINDVVEADKLDEIVKQVLDGNTVLMVDGIDKALVLNAKGGERRSVSEPETETAVRGPREGFTESIAVNIALIRQKIKSSHLKLITKEIGTETRTIIGLMFIDHLASPDLVEEVEKRLERIEIDGILESGYIEELIEDEPRSLFPQIQNTERPDTVVGNLLEGRVALLVNGSPFTLILPATFWQFLQANEDYYHRYHISLFIRLLRILMIFLALMLPAIYIAVTTYHQEMIPTNLLYSIAASRESIPFPAFVEAMIMEIAFESLREAGLRLPKVIGQAVSILGALVIGQAAVEAGIVSAPMVIIVSLTGIASFTIPKFNLAITIRILRFPMMLLAGLFGLFGITLGSILIVTHLCKLRSFGVPYFSPIGPFKWKELKDVFIRAPWWAMDKRPTQTISENVQRQTEHMRPSPLNDKQ
ncbi:putative membrane protein YfkQ [Robertmurraya siralis]|uniref:Membrane protein YfkQ n=1 Tax=Robertmurraya siralis TaxID=77777 RepID=A0A919WFF7_9BACI|nr:spore germination protein [Robertmurraya siralis]GIN60988.1 putative membrane protein YfkQ [Robertmurraya siralis]